MQEFDRLLSWVAFSTSEVEGGHFANLDTPTHWEVFLNTRIELNFSFPALYTWNPARFQPQTTKF